MSTSPLKELVAVKSARTLCLAVVTAGLVLGSGLPAQAADRRPDGPAKDRTAVVAKVVDGDTIDVRDADGVHRVRLLNIDTPETVDPRSPVECLGPEASAFLTDRLPAGTKVALKHDRITHDKYGRELAAVFVGNTFVNAEIAKAGLADAIVIGGNDKFYDRVIAAQKVARTARSGLYAETVACTVPGQVAAVEQQTAALLAQPPASGAGVEAFDAYAAQLAALAAAATTVGTVLAADLHDHRLLGLNAGRVRTLVARLGATRSAVTARAAETTTWRAAEAARIAAEQAATAQAEADRVAAEAAAAAKRAAAKAAPKKRSTAPAPAPAAPAPEAPQVDTYTGCRAYAPGGRTYTKIDCKTKLPIG
ncbi:thermonuclease family protein [Cellulomonas chitinilytica]|uniref:thermonuclease family protein n=1 Tax=Cellulomonas chitinilytica TaxID=398759 RepID=UPI0019432249|nr:thermonuclease family protein [Cellulomonas chitinilytica]